MRPPNVPGTFVYSPLAGTVLNRGCGADAVGDASRRPTRRTTPTATKTTTINVTLKASATITWSAPADITYGTALSATQLNATTTVAGTFVYTPPAGTVLNAGAAQTLSVTFTPTDAANYTTARPRRSTITVTEGAAPRSPGRRPRTSPTARRSSATQLNATPNVPGTFVYTPLAGHGADTRARRRRCR